MARFQIGPHRPSAMMTRNEGSIRPKPKQPWETKEDISKKCIALPTNDALCPSKTRRHTSGAFAKTQQATLKRGPEEVLFRRKEAEKDVILYIPKNLPIEYTKGIPFFLALGGVDQPHLKQSYASEIGRSSEQLTRFGK
ncbi:MAG: hypothetical protein P1V34_15175 [Alphaproteobacteria bacterium]|nr:hypothetical protein [Alphaproteobacteria bacterium]